MYAAYVGHDTIVNLLLDSHANPSLATPTGLTPLMVAAGCGNESVCYFLIQVHVHACALHVHACACDIHVQCACGEIVVLRNKPKTIIIVFGFFRHILQSFYSLRDAMKLKLLPGLAKVALTIKQVL